MASRRTSLGVHEEHKQLLNFITDLRKFENPNATNSEVTEQLIVAYGRQLYTGLTSATWRARLLALINKCEEYQHAKVQKARQQYEQLQSK